MKNIKRLAALLVLFLVTGVSQAQKENNSGGFSATQMSDFYTQPTYKFKTVDRGMQSARVLPEMSNEHKEKFSHIVRSANLIVSNNPVLALLILDGDGSILYESYKNGATEMQLLNGMSMSKSAVSIAVGQALCDKSINSIDDPAQKYARELVGTAYGTASIRQLLMMASAGKKSVESGMPSAYFVSDVLRWRRTLESAIKEFGELGSESSSLGVFEYKGLDTQALAYAVAGAAKTDFVTYFSKNVWQSVRPEKNAGWLVDSIGDPAAMQGLGVTLRDWGRLGLFVQEQIKKDDCLGKYLKQATTGQIDNSSQRVGKVFAKYGYQFWTDNKVVRMPSYWMVGAGGQRVGIDPESGRVIVVISYVENYMVEIYKLFREWIRS